MRNAWTRLWPGGEISNSGVVKRERRHDDDRTMAAFPDREITQTQSCKIDYFMVRRRPFRLLAGRRHMIVSAGRFYSYSDRFQRALTHVHCGCPRPCPYAPRVHLAASRGRRILRPFDARRFEKVTPPFNAVPTIRRRPSVTKRREAAVFSTIIAAFQRIAYPRRSPESRGATILYLAAHQSDT